MQVTQIKDLVNNTLKQIDGESALLNDDLTNTVDIGNEIFNKDNVDNYVHKLIDRIGQTVFNNRQYQGSAPSVLMTAWEFGSVLEKIDSELPDSEENDSWNLKDGQSYDPNIFYQPKVSAKFFNSRVTFDIPMSFTQRQVKDSFNSATELNGFLSMLNTNVSNAMTINIDNLIMKTMNNMTGSILNGTNSMQKVNLLALYNQQSGKSLKAANALIDPDFIKFTNLFINTTRSRLTKISTLFNAGGKKRFTPVTEQHLVLLADLANASKVYLESNTYHDNNVQLDGYETVPYWQGTGKDYGFDSTSAIDVTVKTGNSQTEVKQSGILGVLFDTQALGVACSNQRVTTNYNPKAEFYTNFNKYDASYFNDLNENYIVFYIDDTTAPADKQSDMLK